MFSILPKSYLDFKAAVLSESINGLKMNTFFDNFDNERFNYDGIDRSRIFNVSERIFWLSWFYENSEKLFEAFSLLKTERSRRLFLNLLAYRIGGHHSIRINTRFDKESISFETFKASETFTESRVAAVGVFGKLRHYDFIHKQKRYIADCLGFEYYLYRGQYFFEEETISIMPTEGDFVIDGGACLGDTAIVFGNAVGKPGKVFAFDPVENHLEVLMHNARQNPDCNIQAMPFGLSDADVECAPIKLETYSPGFSSRNQLVPLRALDSLIIGGEIPRIDFLKLDIEGAEMSALRGAIGSIRKFRPKLAISLYHKPSDIFEIPLYIAKEFPFYSMYIDHYTIHNEETVLYCTPMPETFRASGESNQRSS